MTAYGFKHIDIYSSVITGVRFRVYQGVVFLQIQEGELGPMASVYQDTVAWKALPEDFARNIVEIDKKENLFGLLKHSFKTRFMTSVKFAKIGPIWSLRIYGKLADAQSFAFGIMKSSESVTAEDNEADGRLELNGKSPGLANGDSAGQFIVIKNKELVFGQREDGMIAPFFDSSDVSFDIKAPLAGVGFIMYTNNVTYAGFIRPTLIALNYLQYFDVKPFQNTKKL